MVLQPFLLHTALGCRPGGGHLCICVCIPTIVPPSLSELGLGQLSTTHMSFTPACSPRISHDSALQRSSSDSIRMQANSLFF